jgi:hypothetical protein
MMDEQNEQTVERNKKDGPADFEAHRKHHGYNEEAAGETEIDRNKPHRNADAADDGDDFEAHRMVDRPKVERPTL